MVNELTELEIWTPSKDIPQNYADFYELNYQFIDVIDTKTGKEVKLWDIEHAFWNSAILRNAPKVAVPEPAPVIVPKPAPKVAVPGACTGSRGDP